jgi:uncharacterized protein (DUF58 family)
MSKLTTPTTRPALEFDAAFLERLEYLNVVARKILSGILRADRKSIRKGASAEFADHRAYSPGDDIRHVDWHIFGRLDEVFLKLYREEENLHLSLLVDTSASMDRGNPHKLNHALRVAAALAYIGIANMDCVNILPFGERLREGRWTLKGKGRIFEIFDFLRSIEPAGTTSLAVAARELIARERRRGVVVLISDLYDLDGYQQALKYLRHPKHDIYVIHVVDPEEEAPILRGDLRLIDCETESFKEINVTDALLARYRDAFEALASSVESFCVKNEIGYARARTTVPYDELVLHVLRRGGLVG